MKNFARAVVFLFVIFSLQSLLLKLYSSLEAKGVACQEYATIETLGEGTFASHQRSWNGYTYNSRYCLGYQLAESELMRSMETRKELATKNAPQYEVFWGYIYQQLHSSNARLFLELEDSLRQVGEHKGLNKSEFAQMLVTFIQDIPYVYISSKECSEDTYGGSCVPNVPYGILSPFEFLYSLNGDCDTRTVLLYTLLRNFGYHPLILVSKEYRHSMLALDIPAAGQFIMHKGRKYYFWETTGTGWEPGMVPPDMKNTNYWKIALDYEY